MYLGKIVELGRKRQIFATPRHPYTQALLSAVPVPEPGAARARIILKGDTPSPIDRPSGRHFHSSYPPRQRTTSGGGWGGAGVQRENRVH